MKINKKGEWGGGTLSPRFFDLLNSMIYDLKRRDACKNRAVLGIFWWVLLPFWCWGSWKGTSSSWTMWSPSGITILNKCNFLAMWTIKVIYCSLYLPHCWLWVNSTDPILFYFDITLRVRFYRTQVRSLPCLVTPSHLVLNFAQIVAFGTVVTLNSLNCYMGLLNISHKFL